MVAGCSKLVASRRVGWQGKQLTLADMYWVAAMNDTSRMDRTKVLKTTLQSQGNDVVITDATPGQRMGMVWQLTLDAWAFMDPESAKSEFQRHVVRVERGQR